MAGMADLITDDMLDHFAVVCRWDELADRLVERYDGVASRLIIYTAVEAIRDRPVDARASVGRGRPRRSRRPCAVSLTRSTRPDMSRGTLKPEIDPADVGLDAERLERLDRHLRTYVDDGRLPGWLVAVSRHGQLAHVGTYGRRDIEAGLPVETDTIWRIYSMTKPITAVAALIAVGGGRLRAQRPGPLVHPVVRGPAGVARRLVGAPRDGAGHRGDADLAPLHAHERADLRVHAGPPRRRAVPPGRLRVGRAAGLDLAGVCDRLAELPLLFQPGTEWNYGMSTDVLGMVVEVGVRHAVRRVRPAARARSAGDERDDVARRPDERADRLAALYVPTPGTGAAMRFDVDGRRRPHGADGHARRRRAVLDGGRLPPLRRDAAPARRARRRAPARPADGRLHGQQPPAGQRRPHRRSAAGCSARRRSTASASGSASASAIDPVRPRCRAASVTTAGAARRARPTGSTPCSTSSCCS